MKFKFLNKKKQYKPSYMSQNAAGADIYSCINEEVEIPPGEYRMISTGFSLQIPHGYEVQIRPRSGLAAKYGVTVLNSPGTIDSDYRGEVKVILINHGNKKFIVKDKMRVAQMIFAKVQRGVFIETGDLTDTKRGEGGFGHTGH
ncbi:MAG: dUTP diphosphatase [Candidatus Muiribacteriota bacterium]